MFGLFSKKNTIVAIDIGCSSLKLVEIDRGSGGYRLVRCLKAPLRRGVIEKGLMHDSTALERSIKSIVRESGTSTRLAATALSGFSVLVNKITLQDMGEEEIRQLIVDEADEYMPIARVDNVYFDIHVLGTNDHNAENIDVVIAAAKKDVIADYRSVIESAGLRLVLMDVDSFALERAYGENYDFDDEELVVLVHMGASITNLNIVRGGQSVFTRNILMGGNLVTEAIQAARDVSFEDAEEMKLKAADSGGSIGSEGTLLAMAEPIVEEIERSVDFFLSSSRMAFITKAFLSGGSAAIPGMAEELSQRLRCDVDPFNPFQSMSYEKAGYSGEFISEMAPMAPIAVGLALRRIDEL